LTIDRAPYYTLDMLGGGGRVRIRSEAAAIVLPPQSRRPSAWVKAAPIVETAAVRQWLWWGWRCAWGRLLVRKRLFFVFVRLRACQFPRIIEFFTILFMTEALRTIQHYVPGAYKQSPDDGVNGEGVYVPPHPP